MRRTACVFLALSALMVAMPPASAQSPSKKPLLEPRHDAGGNSGTCRAALTHLGARYTRLPAKSASRGCRVQSPLLLTRLAAGVSLTPAAILNCSMAQALARWTAKALVPAARKYLARRVNGLSVAASYVCRRQASGRKMSEHAFANAIDIKAISFTDGTIYRVGQRAASSGQRRFAAEIRRKACAYFTTVLGPGADADHHDHFHFDLRGRRGGYRLCQ